ncbi:D-amino acid dehydrogenase 2 small subunit [Paraburkholderia ribeironis]|uniref:D-amino acid dehydrogenase 2 small subunit n=1 Tax=Paraburkholderia ribeironis TaxID=1247936 RepID=A0A1N7RM00_9BURK|nr:D-amino acid dehydrogenase [Paraburkholderia ribeironis]SIT36126.1 D-amino acid dehydrogenase 2 small subunit [Paraburkholderia ribeironis]
MRVCIVGAGVVGLTGAYFLAREGHDVTVLESGEDVALGASFANGAQLSYSYVAPLADPSVLPHLPAWLLSSDSALRYVPRPDARQWRWCLAFLRACRAATSNRTALELLQLGALSREALYDLVERESIRFDHVQNGKLVVYRDAHAFGLARKKTELLARGGASQSALDRDGCLAVEPSLEFASATIVGGIHTPSEEAGDCLRFCRELTNVLRDRYGVRIHTGARVLGWARQGRRVVAAQIAGDDVRADAFVLSAGTDSANLAEKLGLRLPVYPLTGYSLSAAVIPDRAPGINVTDLHRKIVYARLGEQLRVAGMVEITGADESRRDARLATLIRHVKEVFPFAADYASAQTWCGHRPATPDSKPLVGATPYSNFWLNTGHGALGFTLACGTARLLVEALHGRRTAVDGGAYALSRL